jgi:hypothetical protein
MTIFTCFCGQIARVGTYGSPCVPLDGFLCAFMSVHLPACSSFPEAVCMHMAASVVDGKLTNKPLFQTLSQDSGIPLPQLQLFDIPSRKFMIHRKVRSMGDYVATRPQLHPKRI